ncbi:MAG: TlpA disulfide reductase family protein [Pseudomonadota bacterium]
MPRALKDYAILALAVIAGWYAIATFFPDAPDLEGQAPALSLPDPEGQLHALTDLKGEPVIVNFWATWCPPCVQEIPEFSAFSKDHPEIPVLGVAVDSGSPAEIRAAARRLGISYPVLIADQATYDRWDVSTLPTTVFIAPDGTVAGSHVGGMSREALEKALVEAVGELPRHGAVR